MLRKRAVTIGNVRPRWRRILGVFGLFAALRWAGASRRAALRLCWWNVSLGVVLAVAGVAGCGSRLPGASGAALDGKAARLKPAQLGTVLKCLTGPGGGLADPACDRNDADRDGDVDLHDWWVAVGQ